jgi:hypothetical protein
VPNPEPDRKSRWRRFAARFGVAGFLFFLIKGLLWLLLPLLVAFWGSLGF